MKKKNLLYLFFSLILCLTFLGCSGGGGTGGGGGGQSQSTTYENAGVITPSGGTVTFGNNSVTIPQGALSNSTLISVNQPDAPPLLPNGFSPGSIPLSLEPDGLTFSKPVKVSLKYNDKDNDGIVDYTGIPVDDISVRIYSSVSGTWSNISNFAIDKINKIVTFETNHFSVPQVVVTSVPSGLGLFVYTIDGLDFIKTILGQMHLDMQGYRKSYLVDSIVTMDMGLHYSDVYSYSGGTSAIDAWSGDASKTPQIIDDLRNDIRNKYIESKNNGYQHFVVVGHSWGTVLGYLALDYNPDVKPDLFITLSSPMGTNNVTEFDEDTYYHTITICNTCTPVVQEYEFLVKEARSLANGFTTGQMDLTKGLLLNNYQLTSDGLINAVKWINYWDNGDLISGPVKPNTFNWQAEDKKLNLLSYRTAQSTITTHAITSLNEDMWTKYNAYRSDGLYVKSVVMDDILSVFNGTNYPYYPQRVSGNIQTGTYSFWEGIAPNGSDLFVTNLYDNTISVINTANGMVVQVITNIDNSLGYPFGGAITPNGQELFIANQGIDKVTVYDAFYPYQIRREFTGLGDGPTGIAISPDSGIAYVTNLNSNNVTVIRLFDYQVIGNIPVGNYPRYLAVTPDNRFVYVANESAPFGISVINTSTLQVENFIQLSSSAFQPAITPDGQYVYVSAGSHVYVISTSSQQIVKDVQIAGFSAGPGIAITPNGHYAYVVGGSANKIAVIRTSDYNISMIEDASFNNPFMVVFTPDGRRAYVSNRGAGPSFAGHVSIIE